MVILNFVEVIHGLMNYISAMNNITNQAQCALYSADFHDDYHHHHQSQHDQLR